MLVLQHLVTEDSKNIQIISHEDIAKNIFLHQWSFCINGGTLQHSS